MKLYDDMPFRRGETFYGITGRSEPGKTEPADDHLLGREYIHQDHSHDTGGWVRVRICKNISGVRLVPSKAVSFAVKAGRLAFTEATGHATGGSDERVAIVDDLLGYPVPPNDLFYAVIHGPCLAYVGVGSPVSVGDYLHPSRGGSSLSKEIADPAGKIVVADFGQQGYALARAIQNVVGRAMSGAPMGASSHSMILIHCGYGMNWSA